MPYNEWYPAMKHAAIVATERLHRAGADINKIRSIKIAVKAAYLDAFPEHKKEYANHMEMLGEAMERH